MSEEQQQRIEDCRREVRRDLYLRAGLAFADETIRFRLDQEYKFTLPEIQKALVFLVGEKHVRMEPTGDGATLYYEITSAGMLAHERRR